MSFMKLSDWNEEIPTRGQLKAWLKQDKPGLSECFSTIGSLVLVNKDKVMAWMEKQSYKRPERKGGAGRPPKRKNGFETQEEKDDIL